MVFLGAIVYLLGGVSVLPCVMSRNSPSQTPSSTALTRSVVSATTTQTRSSTELSTLSTSLPTTAQTVVATAETYPAHTLQVNMHSTDTVSGESSSPPNVTPAGKVIILSSVMPQTTTASSSWGLAIPTGESPLSSAVPVTNNGHSLTPRISLNSETSIPEAITLSTVSFQPAEPSILDQPVTGSKTSGQKREELIKLLGNADLLVRETPLYDRLANTSSSIKLIAEVDTSVARQVVNNLTTALEGTDGFQAITISNVTDGGVEFDIVYTAQDIVLKLQNIKDNFRLAVGRFESSYFRFSSYAIFDKEAEEICSEAKACPEGFVCHVTSQVTCVSLCDVTDCGKHGRCALNQTFQPICVCTADRTGVYYGSLCEMKSEASQLIDWKPAAIGGLVTGSVLLVLLLVGISYLAWGTLKATTVRSTASVVPETSGTASVTGDSPNQISEIPGAADLRQKSFSNSNSHVLA